jgi:hypothetical protein
MQLGLQSGYPSGYPHRNIGLCSSQIAIGRRAGGQAVL